MIAPSRAALAQEIGMVRYMCLAAAITVLAGCSAPPAGESTTPPASAEPSVQVLELWADDAQFSTDRLEAVAGVPIVIAFENREALPHNVQLWRDDTRTGGKLFFGELIRVSRIEYELGPLDPGEYRFECHPHSQFMFGHLVVTEAPEH